jgi:hypothetical protein
MPIYLDENGNPLMTAPGARSPFMDPPSEPTSEPVYLDDNGEPIQPQNDALARAGLDRGRLQTAVNVAKAAPTYLGGALGGITGGAFGGPLGAIAGSGFVGAAGSYVAGKALPLVRSAIKPTVSAMRTQAGASMTGLETQANRLAGVLLKNKWTKPEQAANAVQAAEQKLQGVLSGVGDDVVLDTAERIPRYLKAVQRSAQGKIAPGGDPAAVASVGDDVLRGPLAEDVVTTSMGPSPSGLVDEFGKPFQVPIEKTTRALRTNVTPTEGLTAARAQGRWGNRKSWGELKGAEQEGSKAAERAVRDSVKEAVPAARPILQEQGDALKAFPVLDRMAMREANRDQISLPAWVMAAGSGTPGARTALAALANYVRNNQLQMGMKAPAVGQALMQGAGRTGAISGEALRAALIAMLQGQDQASTLQGGSE